MKKIAFIGMGNMGYAMLKGSLNSFDANELIFTCPRSERREEVNKLTGVEFAESNAECANNAKIIVLAVKPQVYPQALKNIENVVSADNIIISPAPGISIQDIKDRLGQDIRVVRCMPNTPALIGEGMTGVSYIPSEFTLNEKAEIEKFFDSFGKMAIVKEELMDAVTCASGCSPAYVYMFIEALADSVVKYGIPRKDAYTFAAQTVLGSAKMVLETGNHPGVLKDNVCSPGGTTIAGVSALEEFGFRNAIIKATDACYDKCTKMK